MDFEEAFRNIQLVWEHKPGAIVLLVLGFVVFIFVVVDAWRHKKHRDRHLDHDHHHHHHNSRP